MSDGARMDIRVSIAHWNGVRVDEVTSNVLQQFFRDLKECMRGKDMNVLDAVQEFGKKIPIKK